MACAQAGDREAYRAVLEDIGPLLLRWLRRWLADSPDLADVYQDTLVHVHRARHTYDPGRPFEPWLFAIARHCAADHARRRRQRAWEVLVDELPDVAAESDPDRRALVDALRTLPRPQREAFSMLKLEGLSVGAAAARAGVTPGALKVRAHRAYKALRALLGGSLRFRMRDPGWQQDLVERLVADVTPVRRLWRPELRLLAWLAVGIPLVVFPMSRMLRDDVVQQLRTPAFLLEEATMLVAAALLALAALRAAVPGRRVGAAISLAAATALALGSLLVLSKPVFTSWTPDVFLAVGLPCLWRSFAWTMVPWALLVIAVRRAAPLRSRWTGALVGAAAWGLTFGALRLCCQTEELTHLGVFHVLPFVTGTVLSGALGPVLFRDRRA